MQTKNVFLRRSQRKILRKAGHLTCRTLNENRCFTKKLIREAGVLKGGLEFIFKKDPVKEVQANIKKTSEWFDLTGVTTERAQDYLKNPASRQSLIDAIKKLKKTRATETHLVAPEEFGHKGENGERLAKAFDIPVQRDRSPTPAIGYGHAGLPSHERHRIAGGFYSLNEYPELLLHMLEEVEDYYLDQLAEYPLVKFLIWKLTPDLRETTILAAIDSGDASKAIEAAVEQAEAYLENAKKEAPDGKTLYSKKLKQAIRDLRKLDDQPALDKGWVDQFMKAATEVAKAFEKLAQEENSSASDSMD
jgi:hypothetical protein